MTLDDAGQSTSWRVPPEVLSDETFCEKYRIESELGVGGAGVVVRAVHLELDRRVAIKFLLPGFVQSDTLVRFHREAWAASRIRDEHVVRIIDVSKTRTGIPYVVMEYLDGTDMERMLLQAPNRQLQVRDAIEFVLQACEALAECHQIGIVHRDLKPSNLFCVELPDGLPLIKVLDFGISKFATFAKDGAMTGQHAILGSPRYMSPEQFDSPAEVDQRTDLWAIGVILYEFVTGRTPFEDNNVLEIWRKVKTEQPRPLHELRRDAPLELEPIILRCLEKDPNRRYSNLAEFAKAMARLASERARGSIARIIRIVESPGVSTESLALRLPPPQSAGPSTVSITPRIRHSGTTRRLVVGVSALLGIGLAAFGLSRSAERVPEPAKASNPSPIQPFAANGAGNQTTVAPIPELHQTGVAPPLSPPPTSPPRRVEPSRATIRNERTPRPSTPVVDEPAALTELPPSAPTASASDVGTPVLSPASSSATSVPAPSSSARSGKWIVDIVDQRKPKPSATP